VFCGSLLFGSIATRLARTRHPLGQTPALVSRATGDYTHHIASQSGNFKPRWRHRRKETMKLSAYHKKVSKPGVLFAAAQTCGALGIEVLAGRGEFAVEAGPVMIIVISGRGAVAGEELGTEDILYVPAGTVGDFGYELSGRAILARFAPLARGPEAIRGHVVIRKGEALGYVRTQYRGNMHGWGRAVAGFNPKGIVYTDKLWGASRDVLAQELAMPAGHIVPVHAHGPLGRKPSADDFWQAYYVWEGSARVDIGRSLRDRTKLTIGPGSVLVYPNGVAHNVVAGPKGCRYVFFERRGAAAAGNLNLDAEKDYERKLTLRLNVSLADFLKENS
jgi:mannose-6-phosphate isomerase-like protein (cupin superfamily)